MKIDRKSSKPLHIQAEELLRVLIKSDEYKDGKLLPNEVDLSKQLQISRNTLRQAINQLVMDGLLTRKKGVGTKVSKSGIVGKMKNWLSFSQEMKMLGIEIYNFELHVSWKKPTEEIRSFFGIEDENAYCLVLERLRGKKEYPFVHFISYFNPAIPFTGDENFSNPLYDILEKNFGITVKTSKEELCARLAGETLASKLRIKPTDPIFVRKRFVYDIKDVPVEYNIGYYRADSFTYRIESER
ncbi:MAG: GntR family transcriptional regulator [Bacteroidales bacterium]